jgi:hypothetical protein
MVRGVIRSSFVSALIVVAIGSTARAQDEERGASIERFENAGHAGACSEYALNLWGLSYHPDRSKGYNERNWGAGLSCFTRPDIPWLLLGHDRDNRLVFEADAMLNSWRGVVVPVSIGTSYRIKTFSGGCKLYVEAALTVAYYKNPEKDVRQVDWGPIPGVSLGCGNVRTNLMFVPSASSVPLAVAIASVSIVF